MEIRIVDPTLIIKEDVDKEKLIKCSDDLSKIKNTVIGYYHDAKHERVEEMLLSAKAHLDSAAQCVFNASDIESYLGNTIT